MVGRARTVVAAVGAFVLLVVLWELVKLLLPDDGVLIGVSSVSVRPVTGFFCPLTSLCTSTRPSAVQA